MPANPVVAIAGIGAALLVGAIAVLVVLTSGHGTTIAGPDAVIGVVGSEEPGDGGSMLVVDVTGAVVAPGVYRLAPGARVGDAIDAAGGFSPRVDAERVAAEINLAAALADGAQIRVPSRDETPPPAVGGPGSGGGGGDGGSGGLIDLNSATQSELESLPGIGPVTATKILESRATAPFATIDELRERGLVGEKTFEDLRALVTVG